MINHIYPIPVLPDLPPFAKLMTKLGETFAVRDVMIDLPKMDYVALGDDTNAYRLVEEKRYSVVPISEDGKSFRWVYCATHGQNGGRRVTELRETSILDHIPDSTPLALAFSLFEDREWYLTLRENRVSGLITYWDFNSREFCLQLYASLSRLEELSRDALVKDGCGVSSDEGLKLSAHVLERVRQRYKSVSKEFGGGRFVDELDFHQVHDALRKHSPWRDFLHQRLGDAVSNSEYDRRYNFTTLRDVVMHGRTVFPTYERFKALSSCIGKIVELIDHLEQYLARSSP